MFAEKVVKPESEVTPCSDARRFLYLQGLCRYNVDQITKG